MILDIVYNGGMVCISSGSMDCFIVGRELCDVPSVISGLEFIGDAVAYHNRTVLSSLPVAKWPASCGFQHKPNPSMVWPRSSI